ncbi:hypothetical protein Tco_1392507 [Tanacetum coccineum]
MSGTIPPPPGASFRHTRNPNRPVTSSGNDGNPNMVEDIFQTNSTNNTGTNNVAPNVVNEDLPQLLDYRGCSHVINVPPFDIDDFTSWKDRFLVYLDGLEPYLLKILENRPYCATAKFMWNDLILSHEGPSDIRDIKIAALRLKLNAFKALKCEKVKETFTRLKILLNELENKDVKISQAKVNATFVNSLPKKWLSMNQTQRANNSIKNDTLATLKVTQMLSKTPGAAMNSWLISMLENQKRFYKISGRVGSARKPIDKSNETCFAYEGVTRVKAFMAIIEDEPAVEKADARSPLCGRSEEKLAQQMSTKNGVNPPAPNPAHNSNFSLLSVIGRERLTGSNYMDWMRNLRFTLRYENKEYVLDEQIPIIDDDSTQEEIEAHQKHYHDTNKVSCIMASFMSPELQKTFENTWAYEMNQQLKEMFQAKASKTP